MLIICRWEDCCSAALYETAVGKTVAKKVCKGLFDPCRVSAGRGGGETDSRVGLDRVRWKPGGKGDCYPLPDREADGAGVSGSSCHAAEGMGHYRDPAEDATPVLVKDSLTSAGREHAPVASLTGRWTVGQQFLEL